jgi:nucleoside-triphosphatase
MKIVDILKNRGLRVGGMISREVRQDGTRIGFEILDLNSSRVGWLAHVNQKSGPRVGKYRVNLSDLSVIGANAIGEATQHGDVVVIDEIGPMELFSEKFREAVKEALESHKPVIAIVHWKAQDKLINDSKNLEDAEIITVTTENREQLSEGIAEKAIEFLEKTHDP